MKKILLISVLMMIAFFACKKKTIIEIKNDIDTPVDNTYVPTALEKFFEDTYLNQNLTITTAIENSTDKLTLFNSQIYVMRRGINYYQGAVEVRSGTNTFAGTWKSNSDYSKLELNITPTTNSAFVFLNREWRFTKKTTTKLELAPWGNAADMILHIQK